MKSSAVWSMLQTTLNGMIFLMLGEQLPRMLRTLPAVASQAGVSSPWYLLLYAVAITLALGLMRFAWVWLSMKLTIFSPQTSGQGHHRPSTLQYPRRHGAGGSEGLCDPRRYSDAAGGAGRWFAVPGP
ncbi:Na+/H+ antiporter [Klebsiella pneumoniae IS53]|nr:Na+/H+ antiporter [Klebsiella pneumoniae IS53]